MFSDVFLAMTAGELSNNPHPHRAYMACHFSVWGKGLSNLPEALPPGSMVLLDDSMPLQGHDPALITVQLQELIGQFQPAALLMDFQRAPTEEALGFLDVCLPQLPCPVAVPAPYAKGRKCPVFLGPPPFDRSIADYLAPWMERGVYLELALGGITVTVDSNGSRTQPLPSGLAAELPLQDDTLHCHYDVETIGDQAVFTLLRTREDTAALLREATALGIRAAVGLYQELG